MTTWFGSRLRTARIRARYSQADVARLLRVTQAKVVAWEKGALPPAPLEAARLACLLSFEPMRLFGAGGLAQIVAPGDDVGTLGGWAPPPGAPRGGRPIKGYGDRPMPRLSPLRCPFCKRWIALTRPACHYCGATPTERPPEA